MYTFLCCKEFKKRMIGLKSLQYGMGGAANRTRGLSQALLSTQTIQSGDMCLSCIPKGESYH